MEGLESRVCSSVIISKRVGLGADRIGLWMGRVRSEGEEEKEDGGGERKKSEMKPCFIMVDTCCLDLLSSNDAIDAPVYFDLQVYEMEKWNTRKGSH